MKRVIRSSVVEAGPLVDLAKKGMSLLEKFLGGKEPKKEVLKENDQGKKLFKYNLNGLAIKVLATPTEYNNDKPSKYTLEYQTDDRVIHKDVIDTEIPEDKIDETVYAAMEKLYEDRLKAAESDDVGFNSAD